jgi:hypothetical protein
MPGFDGTGPQGKGPLTGRGLGYCVLRESGEQPARVEGWAGIDGVPVVSANIDKAEQEKEVIQMPFGDGTGPAGMGPMTGRAAGFGAGFPVPGYRNPGGAWGYMAPYNMPPSGYGLRYGAPYTGWLGRWFRRGLGFARGFGYARGFGFGRGWRGGRARFGSRW